jgi:hypothetical protein
MRRSLLLALATSATALLASTMAQAGEAASCPPQVKLDWARVQLFAGASCSGGQMAVRADDPRPDRADFSRFANFDGRTYDVENSRSSLLIAKGTCVRLHDGRGFTGDASTDICAGSGDLAWNLARFDDRASSMRVFAAPGAAPAPAPAPQPAPQPGPAPSPVPNPDPGPFSSREDFIARSAPLAQATQREFGVPASITLGQAALESGWGKHQVGPARNFFGIKCGVGPARIATGCISRPTRECVSGGCRTVTQSFRRYSSMLDSFRDHGELLRRKYPGAMRVAGDPRAFARELKRGGYATDADYVSKLVRTMDARGLYRYDLR